MKYMIEDADSTVCVDTARATASYDEETRWDGNNHISVVTGSQWEHETLYRSAKGRWYVVHTSQWQGSTPHARWVTPTEATTWLLRCSHALPKDLTALADDLTE